jgi:hypothetical protein
MVTYADEAPCTVDLGARAEFGCVCLRKRNRRGSSQTHERSEEYSELHGAWMVVEVAIEVAEKSYSKRRG